jgi:hypothetical protein
MTCALLCCPTSQRMCCHPTSRSDASPMSVSIASRSAFTSLDDRSWYPAAPGAHELVESGSCTCAPSSARSCAAPTALHHCTFQHMLLREQPVPAPPLGSWSSVSAAAAAGDGSSSSPVAAATAAAAVACQSFARAERRDPDALQPDVLLGCEWHAAGTAAAGWNFLARHVLYSPRMQLTCWHNVRRQTQHCLHLVSETLFASACSHCCLRQDLHPPGKDTCMHVLLHDAAKLLPQRLLMRAALACREPFEQLTKPPEGTHAAATGNKL